jgi:hypothetical protein
VVVVDRPAAIAPPKQLSGRADVIAVVIILLLMAILTMRLVGRAVQPVVQLIRASAAMIAAMLLIGGMGVALVLVLIMLLART